MKKYFAIFVALLFLSGCALSTIKPYKKKAIMEAPKPEKRSMIEKIMKPAPKPAPAPVVEEEEEDIK